MGDGRLAECGGGWLVVDGGLLGCWVGRVVRLGAPLYWLERDRKVQQKTYLSPGLDTRKDGPAPRGGPAQADRAG